MTLADRHDHLFIGGYSCMKRHSLALSVLALCALLFCSAPASSADGEANADSWSAIIDRRNFVHNQDSIKYELPENSGYRIIPRLKNTEVWTRYAVAAAAGDLLEWDVTTSVISSDGPAAGVALWGDDDGYALYLFPDGRGSFKQHAGKKAVWTNDFTVQNFSYPADLTIHRDKNGSMIASVNGSVVAIRLLEYDVSAPKSTPVREVSFATVTPTPERKAGVLYDRIVIKAGGTRPIAEADDLRTRLGIKD